MMNTSALTSFKGSSRKGMTVGSMGMLLVALAYILFCISDAMLTLENDNSQLVKIFAFGLLFASMLLRPIFHRLVMLVGPLLFLLLIGLLRSFNVDAGLEEFIRFLFPIAITIALFAYRDHLNILIKVFIGVVLSNDLFQCYFYAAYITGLPLLLPVRIDSGLYLRAQGWMGFFSEFSFINFCAFMLCRWHQPTKSSFAKSWIFLVFALLGFSFKMFATIALYPVIAKRWGARMWVALATVLGIATFAVANGYLDTLLGVAAGKLSFYITAGNSARAESYRVMFESLAKGNVIGEGLGTFGGPASVKYNSPLYNLYHFDWFGLGSILKTTDTFYPHLFVEIGLLGAVMWLSLVMLYGQSNKTSAPWLFIVAAFCFDNVFSMAFVSPSYVFSALLTMYAFSQSKYSSKICSRQIV
jgi:hypothetical protein